MTESETRQESPDPSKLTESIESVLEAVSSVVLGQQELVEGLLVGYLAGGHVLIEGVPGTGKTLLARCFANVLGSELKRVQFTPDLMPADITGTNVFDTKSSEFRLIKGPLFSEILMADEINRTPPKTQSALLEAMQEGQVTLDGTTWPLPETFFVMATQNPIEFEGTYPLPEAQADRFLLRLTSGLPGRDAELALLERSLETATDRWKQDQLPGAVVTPETAQSLRRACAGVRVGQELLGYLQTLAEAARQVEWVELGPSPRACVALLQVARARARLEGRDFVIPEDIKRQVSSCWGHRVLLRAEAELEGHSPETVLGQIVQQVDVPRSA